jgi:hypothetical protein
MHFAIITCQREISEDDSSSCAVAAAAAGWLDDTKKRHRLPLNFRRGRNRSHVQDSKRYNEDKKSVPPWSS